MFSLLQSLAILAIAISLTVAQGTGVTTSTTSRVFVAYGTSSPSSIQTIHKTVILDTVTRTSTSRVTTTSPLQFTTTVPVIYLSTLNVTSTFRPTTSVFTSNSTIVEYSTFNETSTQYLNKTTMVGSTVATDTTVIIPTPSGFVPVFDSAGNSNYNKTAKRDDIPEENVLLPRQAASSPANAASYTSIISIITRFVPQTTTTVFVTTTKTRTLKPTTITATTTSSFTNTVGVPDQPVSSTTTSFFTTTMNVTRSVVVQSDTYIATSTTVQTNYTSTKSIYAACATNNLLGPRLSGGNYINRVVDLNTVNLGVGTKANSSLECCTICQDPSNSCDFASFNSTAADNKCTLYFPSPNANSSATCSHKTAGYFTTNKASDNVVVINGPCGQLVQGKPASTS